MDEETPTTEGPRPLREPGTQRNKVGTSPSRTREGPQVTSFCPVVPPRQEHLHDLLEPQNEEGTSETRREVHVTPSPLRRVDPSMSSH